LLTISRKAQWVSVRLLHGYLAPRAALRLRVCHHVIKSFSCRIFIYIVSSIFSGHSFICFLHCAPGDRVEYDSTSILSVRGLLSRFRSCTSLFNFCQASEAPGLVILHSVPRRFDSDTMIFSENICLLAVCTSLFHAAVARHNLGLNSTSSAVANAATVSSGSISTSSDAAAAAVTSITADANAVNSSNTNAGASVSANGDASLTLSADAVQTGSQSNGLADAEAGQSASAT